ncbi:hypothetical protein [Mesorhizobium sp.]|uniref:hypothetical protein n=1 Tax=Mesorhizobium sp. TaxID=1871066 RepID=UPI0025DF249F|nr:hypothetical protein [Mesorhizobium sp.]
MTIEIRRLFPCDAALVMQAAGDVFDQPVRADRLAAYLASPGHFMIAALADGIALAESAEGADEALELERIGAMAGNAGAQAPFEHQAFMASSRFADDEVRLFAALQEARIARR